MPYKLHRKHLQVEEIWNTRHAYAPLVLQCRYSGIEVPDHLWAYKAFATDKKYSDNQAEHLAKNEEVLKHFDDWTDTFVKFLKKEKCSPENTGLMVINLPHILRPI